MPSLRNTRQSRTASPFVRANASPAPTTSVTEQKDRRLQSSLDSWVEPPLRSPVPSFQDHGMERTALFQEMQPLGSLPPTKLKLRVRGDIIRPDKSDSVPASDAATGTPEGTPPVEPKSSTPPLQELEKAAEKTEEMEIDAPKAETVDDVKPEVVEALASLPPASRSPAKLPAALNGTPSSTPAHSRQTSTAQASPNPKQARKGETPTERYNRMREVVAKATALAREKGDTRLARALDALFLETATNYQLAVVLDAVITNKSTEAQAKEFQEHLHRVRRAIKKNDRAARRGTIGTSIPPAHYSHQQYAPNSTMAASMGYPPLQQPTIGYPPHINQQTPRPPPHLQQPIFSPPGAHRGVLQPSPFSPTQSQPTSPQRTAVPNSHIQQTIPPKTQPGNPPSATASPLRGSSTPKPQTPLPDQDLSSTMVSTRRSTRAAQNATGAGATSTATPAAASANAQVVTPATNANATATAAPTATASTAPTPAAATNGVKKKGSVAAAASTNKAALKNAAKAGAKGKKRTSSDASDSSGLSSVDEDVVEKGAPVAVDTPTDAPATAEPTAALATGSAQPSRAASRASTPRPGAAPKGKQPKKGSNLKNLAGSKRAADAATLEEDTEEARKRRDEVEANFKKDLRQRKEKEPPTPKYTSFRETEEYQDALDDTVDGRTRRTGRRSSGFGFSQPAASSGRTTKAATPAPAPAGHAASTGRRTTRESTLNQRSNANVIDNAPCLEVTTPSTPAPIPSDAESNGDPPPAKRRKLARVKRSPIKLPNGQKPPAAQKAAGGDARGTPSRSSPPPSIEFGGRAGKLPNRDECYACGCGGDLVCCDMCQNAFHAECWDPPCHADDEEFEGCEWLCTHCRIFERRKENEDRVRKGEPMIIDSDESGLDDNSDDDDIPITPPDWSLVDKVKTTVPLFKGLNKTHKEMLPVQFGLKNIMRSAYNGNSMDAERRYKPVINEAIVVDGRARPYETVFDEGKHIKNPEDLKACYKCGMTALSKKGDIVKCDVKNCQRWWHIDCVDTPMTAPPQTWSVTEKRGPRVVEIFKKRYWECPLHLDKHVRIMTETGFYADDRNRGVRVRWPRGQPKANKQPGKTTSRFIGHENQPFSVHIDDKWWESYDERMNEYKDTEMTEIHLHENQILADFAKKARNDRLSKAMTPKELIGSYSANPHQAQQMVEHFERQIDAEVNARIARDYQTQEAAQVLATMRQSPATAPAFETNDLLAQSDNNDAIEKLAGAMSADQIKQMMALLTAVNDNKAKRKASDDAAHSSSKRKRSANADDEDEGAAGSEKDDTPSSKRAKVGGAEEEDEEEL